MESWIGCSVSINCGQSLGCYQGRISEATVNQITLVKSFRNGVPYPHAEVTINSTDIIKLQLLEEKSTEQIASKSTVSNTKPIAKRQQISVSDALTCSHNRQEHIKQQAADAAAAAKTLAMNAQLIDLETGTASKEDINTKAVDNKQLNKLTPSVKTTKGKRRLEKNEACFGAASDLSMNQDFDFEKNLALFDKQAVWNEINASQKPDLVRQTDPRRSDIQKYRHDENVIATLPTMYRQISIKEDSTKEYVTDDGLIIPSVSSAVRERLFLVAEKLGLSVERQIELMGRAATEISLQLLGGGHRLNPRNTHQFPTVVVLCGNHRQGAVGVNCARQLASHSVDTVVYCSDTNNHGVLRNELSLYRLTGNKITTNVADLPNADLIILSLSSEANPILPDSVVIEWINENRAPVLALDPPSGGTFGVCTKISLIPVLPLAHSNENGRLYLCNLAIPDVIFKEIGIKYRSPFGPKFVIPLYSNDK